jgi:hypothetical protein
MDAQLSPGKRIAFVAVSVLLVLLCVELASYILLNKFIPSRVKTRAAFRAAEDYVAAHNKAVASSPRITAEQNQAASDENRQHIRMFHPVLGWDYPPNVEYADSRGIAYHHGSGGERRTCTSFEQSLVATYGDSFTYSADEEDCHSWQTYLGEKIHGNVLNFGVSGYGTDQAYLKYELNSARVWTPVVIMGILPDNSNRVVNVFRSFYAPSGFMGLTKPRYVRKGETFELLSNPLSSPQDMSRLQDPAFVRELGQNDYWYQQDMNLPRLGFPYTLSLVLWRGYLWEHLAFALNLPRGTSRVHFFPGNLFEEKEPLAVMRHVVDLFVQTAKARNSRPVVVIMSHKELVLETRKYGISRVNNLVKYLQDQGYDFVDLIDAMVQMNPTKEQLDSWYREHATPEGNKVIAGIIAAHLKKEGYVQQKRAAR